MDEFDAIYKRKSIRKYSMDELHVGIIEELKYEIRNVVALYKDIDMDIHIVEEGKELFDINHGIIANYLKIKAPHYIVVTSEIKEGYLENVGFSMEPIVLKLTEMGIGTCWTGNIVKRELLKKVIDIKETHEPVIVISFGYPRDDYDLSKNIVKSRSRVEISKFTSGNFGKTWQHIMEAVKVAPSSINSQPWRFFKSDNIIDVYSVTKKGIFKKKLQNMNRIDVGIALSHINIAAKNFDIDVEFKRILNKSKENYIYITSIVENEKE